MHSVLIVGCGYIGRRVARVCIDRGADVIGVVRSIESAGLLENSGIIPCILDLDDENARIPHHYEYKQVFYFAPPPPQGDSDTRMEVFLEGLYADRLPTRMVYISTTAVYGDCGGKWIDESQPVSPGTSRGKRRLAAEHALSRWCRWHDVEYVILRVPGIYGPGKLPLDRIRKGLPVLRVEDSPYTNRVHADDLARACLAAMERARSGSIYNVSDGHPSTMTDYFFRIADLAALPRPPQVTRGEAEHVLSPGMLSFMKESRRLTNEKMLDELGIQLHYPDLVAGLPSCLDSPAR
jgi:nucleoside-diphosphate-sugar epimerase